MKVAQADQDFNFRNSSCRRRLYNKKEFTFAYFNLGKGQLSIGGIIIHDDEQGYKLYYAVALCSPEDKFVKRTGRVKIEQHLILPKHSHKRGALDLLKNYIQSKKSFDILLYAADYYLAREYKHLPQWAKENELTFRNTYKETNKKEENNKYYTSYLVV